MAANPNPLPNPNENLVRVLETEQESEALVVRGLLDSAGIDCDLMSIDFPQDVLPVGGVALLVREEDAAKARQLIDDYRRTPFDGAAAGTGAAAESAAAEVNAEVNEDPDSPA
jgi:hypothetical protein